MSFKDLARIEGYNFDLTEVEAKAGKVIISTLRWTNQQLLAENQRLEQELSSAMKHIAELERENQQLKKQNEEFENFLDAINNGVTIP